MQTLSGKTILAVLLYSQALFGVAAVAALLLKSPETIVDHARSTDVTIVMPSNGNTPFPS